MSVRKEFSFFLAKKNIPDSESVSYLENYNTIINKDFPLFNIDINFISKYLEFHDTEQIIFIYKKSRYKNIEPLFKHFNTKGRIKFVDYLTYNLRGEKPHTVFFIDVEETEKVNKDKFDETIQKLKQNKTRLINLIDK